MCPRGRGYANDPAPDRRLRIGYVSADFREHCQSFFTIPLLSRHDHTAFEVFCYASVERPDDITRRIAGTMPIIGAMCERSMTRRSPPPSSEDRIDLLVDLTMHMAGGRPLLFARRPAPVQIAWLAYPGTTGMGAMDFA